MKAIFNSRSLLYFAFFSVLALNTGCGKKLTETQIITNWIWDGMNEIYLWADEIPAYDPDIQTDPEAFFDSLLYKDDHWSWITDDYEELVNSFNGIELSTGIYPAFYRIGYAYDLVMVVAYVFEGSPADSAGIKRGDIIYAINNQMLSEINYLDLFYSTSCKYSFASYNTFSLFANGIEKTVKARIIEENPILYSDVLLEGDKKIGYLSYAQFSKGEGSVWLSALTDVLAEFKSQAVDEVVIDLRYNPGGAVEVANALASALAPATVMNNHEVLAYLNWNDLYDDYFRREYGDDSENLVEKFSDSDVNLDLDRVFFLTTYRSASACELLISGLDPWMNVIQIGENTYGKYTASVTIPDFEDPPRHNWAMQPIVLKYSNAVGYTDFIDGLTPDYEVYDYLFEAVPFGDVNDPQLAKALELISGVAPSARAGQSVPEYTIMPDPHITRKVSEINSIELPVRIK